MMEYFVASGKKPPLEACLAKVDEADVVVAIVAHRYGWVPPDQGGDDHKSITWLECQHGVDDGKEVLAFVVDKAFSWPVELRESYRTSAAVEDGSVTPQLIEEVQRNVARLGEFKDWLNSRGIRATFTTPDDLRGKVEAALRESKSKPARTRKRPRIKRTRQDNPRRYLRFLREETAYIDIRGLGVRSGKAHSFPIEDLYIPLTTAKTTEDHKAKPKSEAVHLDRPEKVELHEALTNNRLVIIGDPGSGKTTFLRRIAFALCQTWLGEDPQAAESRLGIGDQPFPVFISVGKLIEHIGNAQHSGSRDAPTTKDSAAWLPHYLATASQELSWELSPAFFSEKLKEGSCILLLDGLDEAPNRRDRESVAPGFAWVDTKVFDETKDESQAVGWCPTVVDTNGDGVITKPWNEWGRSGALYRVDNARGAETGQGGGALNPELDTQINYSMYSVISSPVDDSIWGASQTFPGYIVRMQRGDNAPSSCTTQIFQVPEPGFDPCGIDIDTNGVVWSALAGSSHLASFDVRKCTDLEGPGKPDGSQCREGWTLYPAIGPKMKGTDVGADFHYYNWVDQHNIAGFGANTPIATGSNSDSLLVLNPETEEWTTLRVPYPLGFFTRGLDGRIDDPEAGWKGRGLWANYGTNYIWHTEGGKGTKGKFVKFQIRPDPLAR